MTQNGKPKWHRFFFSDGKREILDPGEREKEQWYSDILPTGQLPVGERSVFAVRGTLPQFPRTLSTIRITHLFGTPDSAKFPGVPNATHHFWIHSRIRQKSIVSGKEVWDWSKPILSISLQVELPALEKDYLNLSFEEQASLDKRWKDLTYSQRASNYLAKEVGEWVVDRWLPRVKEEWLITMYVESDGSKDGHLRLHRQERKLTPQRIAEWSGAIDYAYKKVAEKTVDFIEVQKWAFLDAPPPSAKK